MKTLLLPIAFGVALAAADMPFKRQVFNDLQSHSRYYQRSAMLGPRHLDNLYQNIRVRSLPNAKSNYPSSARGDASSRKTPIGPHIRSSQTSSFGRQLGLRGSPQVGSPSLARAGRYKPLSGSESGKPALFEPPYVSLSSVKDPKKITRGKIKDALQAAAENPGTTAVGAVGGVLGAVGAGGQSYLGATTPQGTTAQHVAGAVAPVSQWAGTFLTGYAGGKLVSEMGKIQEQNSANQGHQSGGSPRAASTSSQPTLENLPQAGQRPITGAGGSPHASTGQHGTAGTGGSPRVSTGQHGTAGDVEQGIQEVPKKPA